MRFKMLYRWNTRVGEFFIGQSDDGRFHPVFKGESYGSYSQTWQASEDLAHGHTYSITGVTDIKSLGIPDHVREWERVH